MSKQNLTSLISQLQSDKVKQRQDALSLLTEAFVQNDKLINMLAGNPDEWLAVFRALFAAVNSEKAACLKKGFDHAPSASLSRLEKAGETVRTVTERSVSHMNGKVTRTLLTHLVDTMTHKGNLVGPLSSNYAKAILDVCSYTPHLEHVDSEKWISLVSLAFAVILGDSLRGSRGFAEDEKDEESDSELDMPQESDMETEPSGSSKRRRGNSTRRSVQPAPQSGFTAGPVRPVSPEQTILMSLLIVLFSSPWAPYMSPGVSTKILHRLQRFFLVFPSWSGAHHLALNAINIVLSQVELNDTRAVTDFGLKVWSSLLSYWNRKEKNVKAEVTIAMTTLLPFVTKPDVAEDPRHHVRERVVELYTCLEDDLSSSRSGFEGLSFDSMRFQLRDIKAEKDVFEADTFRAGFQFSAAQALAWASMELLADCARTLHLYSERFGSPVKRRKLETPLSTILTRAKDVSVPSKVRVYQLQALLFVIDRHWAVFHDTLQQEVVSTLLDLLLHEDPPFQSWTFLCLASIVASKGTVDSEGIDWDSIWSHSIRRTNLLNVCRAACHTAHVLLASQRLPVHRALTDIESFSRDLVVQGPTYPYDSVCAFLCDCLGISSQDMRLHRIQLPDKVLSWLSENWNMSGPDLRAKMPPHGINDVLALLEATCGLSQGSQMHSRYLLPECTIVETAIERQRTAAIRDYLLHARIAPFRPLPSSNAMAKIDEVQFDNPSHPASLAAPNPREIKVSAFLLKSLDFLCGEWQNAKDPTSEATAGKVRRSLDAAVVALCFEASLVRNRTQSNRRVLQTACKLVSFTRPCLDLTRWSPSERALILMGLEPLTSDGDLRREDDPWQVMPGPGRGSGVKRSTLVRLSREVDGNAPHILSPRRELQSVLWQSADVQDTFESVMATLRNTVRVIALSFQDSVQASDEDAGEGFVTREINNPGAQAHELKRLNQLCVQVCMTFLTVAPMLQSGKFLATRDKGLTDLLIGHECDPHSFLILAPEFFQAVRSKHIHVGASAVQKFINRFEELLNMYAFSRSATATMLAIQFLHSTAHIWMQPAATGSKRGVRLLYAWLSNRVLQGSLGSWRIRDRFICFLDHYMTIDPREAFLTSSSESQGMDEEKEIELDEDILPSRILPKMADDEDTRVRFRVAVANGRLLCTTDVTKGDPMRIYERIKNEVSLAMDDWEHMLTRFLHLGNAMVASSAVRRGPYWHLLEICLHHPGYTAAVEAVVSAVADRLGLPSLRSLFEAYASQLVRSVMEADQKFFRFPPSLLGYADRRQCARATFPMLAPMILETGDEPGDKGLAEVTRRMFEDHCSQAQKSVPEGLFECFADVVGTRIVHYIDFLHDDIKEGLRAEGFQYLAQQIHQLAADASEASEPATLIRQNLDQVVYAILRTISDEDYSREGPIAWALKTDGRSDRAVATFHALTIYRKPEDFKMHRPNLPAFSSLSVLRSINWLSEHVDEVYTPPIIYHVVHHLLAAIGRSVLVNEQMRLLHALSMWISINASSFKDISLLRTLMRGAITLLSQCDLAHFAQGILSWAFGHYGSLKEQLEPTFPDLIGQIARIAHDYSRDTSDPVLVALGSEIMDWVEKQAWTLSRANVIKPQILSALPLWPRQPTGQLEQLSGELNQSQSLSDVLRNPRVTSGKFRLVRRLRDLVDAALYPHDQFCGKDFWHLKSCIPPHDQMQDEDIDAFVDILFKNAAQIVPLGDELVSIRSVAKLHKEISWTAQKEFKVVSPRRVIIISLFDILSTGEASQINRAYTTLRRLFALPIPELSPQDWPPEYRTEISYLSSCPLTTMAMPTRSLNELQTSDIFTPGDFSQWVCEVAMLLNDVLACTDIFYAQLSLSLHSDTSFAAQMLPVLVHAVLLNNKDDARKVLSEYFSSILEGGSSWCCRSVVDVVLHLRNFIPTATRKSEDPLAGDKWLDIDFRLLSRGAMSCGAYTTALLFLELAAEYQGSSAAADSTAEEILYAIYSHIEEPDGFYAIKSNDIRGFLTRRFHHEGQWDKAFQFHGADFAAGAHGSGDPEGVYQSLHSNGFDNLAMAVLQSSNSQAKGTAVNSSDLGYQLAWRTEMWDLPEPHGDGRAGSALYSALRAIHRDRDLHAVDVLLRDALRQEMSLLRDTGSEDMVGIRERLQTLLSLGEIRKWRWASVHETLAAREVTPETWADFVHVSPEFDFTTIESIIATRMSLLRSTKLREQREQIGDLESAIVTGLKDIERSCLVRLSEAARMSDHHQIALNATVGAQRLERVPTFEVSQEFANVLWLQKEHKLAVEYLKGLVTETVHFSRVDQEVPQRALILSRLGTWSAEACLQKPTDIREKFFDPATKLLLGSDSQDMDKSMDPALAVVFHQYALFAEDQYHMMLRSPEVSRLQVYVERKKQEIQQLQESMNRLHSEHAEFKELKRHRQKAETLRDEDAAQMSVQTESRMTFLIQAIEMYSRCLQASDEFDDSAVIRLCSLWFSSFNDTQMQRNFNHALKKVPSRKFVFLAHQLSARLFKPDTNAPLADNQKYLQALVVRMCNEHPFHSLYQVWALQQGTPHSSRRQFSRESQTQSQPGRASAAADIFAICRQTPHNSERVKGIERLCQAYLEWAQFPLKSSGNDPISRKRIKVPTNILLRGIRNMLVPVTTAHTPLDPTLRYDNIVTVVRYVDTYRLAGGNNLPKISECLGSDGHLYTQLFKGEGGDDLRQDAVMEQVFELVNVILRRDRQTLKRHLSVRCYKVVPLAPQAGLLEFVQNTMPIGEWLWPAHQRHSRPGVVIKDVTKAFKEYRKNQRGGVINDLEDLRRVFLDTVDKSPPVFRHFFTERYKLPMAWFSARLNYARSAATTSIVGHILGLGDRHVSNILIDKTTGELVHIDLGIAFDQGKLLPVPELVPFRLTGDMVDGLGTAGTEGVFRRCAEETLRVLRAESGVITTVLEVFRHDPLHSWTASAIKINRIQGTYEGSNMTVDTSRLGIGIDMASDSADESADRALTSVHRKLDKSLSVEYTVNELIVSATDTLNLAQIFAGWSPFL